MDFNGRLAIVGESYRTVTGPRPESGSLTASEITDGELVMRIRNMLALVVAGASFAALALPASAADFGYSEHPRRFDRAPVSEDYDRYGYVYEPRGYYPYYNSGYWGPPRIKRYSGALPPYFAAWGADRADYYHTEWHMQHYGGHRRGNW